MLPIDTVIVTGSSGFIGSALINKLAGRYRLVGFDKIATRAPPPVAECVCIDLTSKDAIEAAFKRVRSAYGDRIASVIHLAAYYDLSGEPSPLYEQITVRGTERLLEQLKEFQVEQFIFSSTMLVHSPTDPGQRINEDSATDPRWSYPQSKLETEALIRENHGDIPVVLLRLAGVYDDRRHSPFLSQQIARIYERQLLSHVYPGDIRRGQASVHLDDVTDAFAATIARRGELPKELTLLVGEPETLSYDAVQRQVGWLLHSESWDTREIPEAMAKTGAWLEDEVLDEDPFIKPWMVEFADDHYALDTSRSRAALDWEPKHALKDTLSKITDALKSDPVGWYRTNKLNAARVADRASIVSAPEPMDRRDHPKMVHEHEQKMRQMHFGMIWVHFVNILLGAWLITAPFILGVLDQDVFSEAVRRASPRSAVSGSRRCATAYWYGAM